MITILIPCYNEERYIEKCLRSVLDFELTEKIKIEVLVLDGGSTDATRDIVATLGAQDFRIRLIDNPGRIQSIGLNIGIRESSGEWIMRLDAHTRYPPDYLMLCYQTAIETGADNVGGVCITHPGGEHYAAQFVQALTTHKFGVGNSGFRTGAKAGPRDTVPFGFFRRNVFDRIGFFDERLVRTQDYEFNRRLAAAGGKIYLNPDIQSSYFNLPDFRSFLKKQLQKQGPYNAYMWYLAPYAFVPRHAITGCFSLFFWAGLLMSPVSSSISSIYISILTLYFTLGFLASIQQALRYKLWRHLFFLPFGFFLFHISHGTGVLVGLFKLFTHSAPVQKGAEPWPGAGKFRAWP